MINKISIHWESKSSLNNNTKLKVHQVIISYLILKVNFHFSGLIGFN